MSSRPTLILPSAPNGQRLMRAGGAWTAWDEGAPQSGPWDIILPGQMVRIYRHELPKMREREKLAAAGFAIEDKTGAALETQHIALGTGGDNRVAVIDKAELQTLIESLESEGIETADIYADFDWVSETAAPVRLPDRVIFAGPEGYTIDPEWADKEIAGLPETSWDALELNENALSLRQGEFAKRRALNVSFDGLGRIAALLAISGLAWLGLQGASARAASQHAKVLRAETAQAYQQATGLEAPANPALAVTRAVKSSPKSASSFLALSAKLNAALAQTGGTVIETVSYDQNKSQLNLRLIYPSFDAAGELERAAASSGGVFRPGGVREQNGILIGDAVFEMGAPS